MVFIQQIKNMAGDLLGEGRCPVTGDTYLGLDTITILYTTNVGIHMSKRALNVMKSDDIARKVIEATSQEEVQLEGERKFSVEEISAHIQHALQKQGEYWII